MSIPLCPEFALPDEAVTQTFGILAVRGAGKSNTAAVMAEGMAKAGLPFVVIDVVGNWWGLRSAADGTGPGLHIPIFGGSHGDVPLERTSGQLVADLIAEQRLSCVVDIWDFSEGDKTRFLIDFAERLYRKNAAPLHLFLEEADDYIPQRPIREQARLVRAWENIVRRGRSRGLGMTLITQRSAALNKNVLTQVETLIAMRTTSPQDRKAIEGWVNYHGEDREIIQSLPGLKNGEAWIWSPSWLGVRTRVQMARRRTFDSASTPTMRGQHRPPATLADVDLDAIKGRMMATIERAKQEDPRELRLQISQLRRDLEAMTRRADAAEADWQAAEKKVAVKEKRVEIPVLNERLVGRLEGVLRTFMEKASSLFEDLQEGKRMAEQAGRAAERPALPVSAPPVRAENRRVHPPPTPISRLPSTGESLAPAKQRLLNALGFLESIGLSPADKTQLALLADARPTSGAYFNNLGALRTSGLIAYPKPGDVALTDQGRSLADPGRVPGAPAELHEQIRAKMPPAKWRLLEVLIAAYPAAMAKDELARRAGARETSGAYFNNLGSLRSLGLIDYPERGQVVALPILFLERR